VEDFAGKVWWSRPPRTSRFSSAAAWMGMVLALAMIATASAISPGA
jgi:hypothetical protein